MIILVAEMKELKANPNKNARGAIVEAQLDKGRGPVATVLVQNGTLQVGDPIVAGAAYGKIRAMTDDKGRRVKKAGPSTPEMCIRDRAVSYELTVFYIAAGDSTNTGRFEQLTYFCMTQYLFFEYGIQQTFHSSCDVFDSVIDDTVQTLSLIHILPFLFRWLRSSSRWV